MGKAIKVILVYVGLPLLVFGLILGMIFQYNLNSNREAHYDVTELCVGKSCGIYERFIKSGNEVCKNLFDGRGTYLDGGCFNNEEIVSCLKNSTYQKCIQEYGGDMSSIIEMVDSIKGVRDQSVKEKEELSADLRGNIDALAELRQVFDSVYPDTFYCYGDGAIEYGYEIEEVNKTTIDIKGAELIKRYYIEQCALCSEGKNYEIICMDDSSWRDRTEWEWAHCQPCEGNSRERCESGFVENEVMTKVPVNVTVDLEPETYTKIDMK